MKKFVTAAVGALLLAAPVSSATADGSSGSVFWQTIIGIITVPSAPTMNLVGPVIGAGEPWSTLGGQAYVDLLDNKVQFDVRGLVLAGGNSIGTPATITDVLGTLVCSPSSSPTVFVTPPVALSAQGNAEFSGSFTSSPAACSPTNVAFLITIPNASPPPPYGHWIAYGAVRVAP